MKLSYSKISYGLVGAMSLTLLQGCDESDTNIVGSTVQTSISGKAISAETGKGIAGASVKLRINGQWHYTSTQGGTGPNAGDFKFASSIPQGAAFYIIIDPVDTAYADAYTYGNTNATDSGSTSNQIWSNDIGNIGVYKAADTTITLVNATDGEPIEGISMWTTTVNTGNPLAAGNTVATPLITPTTSTVEGQEGVYTWSLPDTNQPVNILVNGLVTEDGTVFQTLAGDLLQNGNLDGDGNQSTTTPGTLDNTTVTGPIGTGLHTVWDTNSSNADASFVTRTLTSIVPGVDSTIYLRPYTPTELTVSFDLFDNDDGSAFATAGRAIDVQDTATSQIFSAVQDSDVSNRYNLTIPYRRDITFAISSLDIDGDGFKDTQTTLVTAMVDRKAGVNSVNVAVQISDLTDFTALTATTIGSTVTPGVGAEALVVFNQPVELTGDENDTQVMFSTLNDNAAGDDTDYINPIQTILNAAGTAGGITLTQQANPNANRYDYTANSGASVFTASGARGTDGQFIRGYEKRVDSDINYITGTAAQLNSAGNIYRISVSNSDIEQHQSMNIAMSVRNVTTGEISTVTVNVQGQASTATFSALTDITIDDGNYIDNAADDPTTNLGSKPLYVNTDTDNLQTIADTNGLGSCGASNCLFLAEQAPTTDANVGLTDNLALLAPKAFYGHVKLVSYTIRDLDSDGVAQNTTTQSHNTSLLVFSDNDELMEMTGTTTIGAATTACDPTGPCSQQGSYYYHLAIPSNHDIDEKSDSGDALNDVFGSTVADFATGYNKQDGLTYTVSLADLGLPTSTTDSILKTVVLDLDIIVDGVRMADTVTLNVN